MFPKFSILNSPLKVHASCIKLSCDRKGTLALFAVLAGSAGLLVFRLPDTLGVLTPNTARDVSHTLIKMEIRRRI